VSKNSKDLAMFIDKLEFLLNYTHEIYLAYCENSKKFLYAEILFDANQEIITLVKKYAYLLPKQNSIDAISLLYHLQVWSSIWRAEVRNRKPRPDDAFIFKNRINFPKNNVNNLLAIRKI
jgi:hypothetical protein